MRTENNRLRPTFSSLVEKYLPWPYLNSSQNKTELVYDRGYYFHSELEDLLQQMFHQNSYIRKEKEQENQDILFLPGNQLQAVQCFILNLPCRCKFSSSQLLFHLKSLSQLFCILGFIRLTLL